MAEISYYIMLGGVATVSMLCFGLNLCPYSKAYILLLQAAITGLKFFNVQIFLLYAGVATGTFSAGSCIFRWGPELRIADARTARATPRKEIDTV